MDRGDTVPQSAMKALLQVGCGCGTRCGFCPGQDGCSTRRAAGEVDGWIDRAAALGHTLLVLSGAEPAAPLELLGWAARVAWRGMDLGLATHGRTLRSPVLVDKLLRLRLRYVELGLYGLYGNTAEGPEGVFGREGLEPTLLALRNLTGRGLELTVTTVLTRWSVEHLRAVVDAVRPFPEVVLRFSLARPRTPDEPAGTEAVPDLHRAAGAVCDALDYGLARAAGSGPAFTHEGLALCMVPGYEDRYDDLKARGFTARADLGDGDYRSVNNRDYRSVNNRDYRSVNNRDYRPVDDRDGVRPEEVCGGCALRGACPGVPAGYAAVHGEPVLRAVTDRPQSNSYNYVLEAAHGTLVGEGYTGCPVYRGGVSPWDRGRVLFIPRGVRVARVRTATRDFTDREIERTVHALGQVYLDVSDKPAPDDFPRDLVQLRRSARCGPCPSESVCAGLWEPSRVDPSQVEPFTRDDARVRDLLGGLSGDVLDVGCGEGPYEDIFGAAVARGAVRYVGIDPDGVRVEALRARWPWADVRVGTAEALDPERDGRFDHVLVLRSWNHLRDPAQAAGVFVRLLRPGGVLTVVDNVAFGLVRTRAQTVRAEGGLAAFEHYRNDGAAEAAHVLARAGFTVTECWEVGRGSSNQWLLRCHPGMGGDSRSGLFGL